MFILKIGVREGECRECFSVVCVQEVISYCGDRHGTLTAFLNLSFIKSISLKPLRGEKYLDIPRNKESNDTVLVRCHVSWEKIR